MENKTQKIDVMGHNNVSTSEVKGIAQENAQTPATVKQSGERAIESTVFDTQKLFFQSRMQKLRKIQELVQRLDDTLAETQRLSLIHEMQPRHPKLTWHCDRCFKAGFVGVAS